MAPSATFFAQPDAAALLAQAEYERFHRHLKGRDPADAGFEMTPAVVAVAHHEVRVAKENLPNQFNNFTIDTASRTGGAARLGINQLQVTTPGAGHRACPGWA